jgi:hypothetical protein
MSNETLMNSPPDIPFSRGALRLPLPACALVTAKLRTPVQSIKERGAPKPRERTSVGASHLLKSQGNPAIQTGRELSTPAQQPLRPWVDQDHPGTTLYAAQLGKMETMFYNISLIAGQIF